MWRRFIAQKTYLPYMFFFLLLWNSIFTVSYAMAANWQPRIYDEALPQHLVAVDKSRQHFYFYERKSPLTLKFSYPCTTGEIIGDKQIVNDLRTPEGIYFVDYKIDSGLDFKEYGGIAYTLNYPNPVDKLRGKTGYGIWIHSKGEGISPRTTKGCIAIGLDDIAEVGPLLLPGTAVVVGESLSTNDIPLQDNRTVHHLRMRMEQWTHAWANRSQQLFTFYDPKAYTQSMPESFEAFKSNKERLFKILAWINIFNRTVHVLEGPGYWVTWAEQFYRAPNLSTEGIRRLYWQPDTEGEFRIVGMEWIPRNVGMRAAYEKSQLVAETNTTVSDAPIPPVAKEEIPILPPLSMPENTEQQASNALASNTAPHGVEQTPPIFHTSDTIALHTDEIVQLQQNINAWKNAWQTRSDNFFDFYDAEKYGKIPNLPHKESFSVLTTTMRQQFQNDWIEIAQRPAHITIQGNIIHTSFDQFIWTASAQPIEGQRHLYWQKNTAGEWRIVASSLDIKNVAMQAVYLEKISASVANSVETWREDWLNADIKAYMRHYAPHAKQQGKKVTTMMAQKQRLWSVAPPAIVQLSGMRIQLAAQGIRIDMTQIYEDKNGRGDKGIKTLLLQPRSTNWYIIQEDWAPIPQ